MKNLIHGLVMEAAETCGPMPFDQFAFPGIMSSSIFGPNSADAVKMWIALGACRMASVCPENDSIFLLQCP